MCYYALKAFKCKACGQSRLPELEVRCSEAMKKNVSFGKCSTGVDPKRDYLIAGPADECEPWSDCMCSQR